MIELLKLLLSLSFSGTVLILILLLSRPLYRNRLSRQWQYYIWLIVVARMLLPFTPEPSLTGSLFQASGSAVMQLRPDGPELLNGRPIPGTDLTDEDIPSDSSGAESAKSMEPGAAGLKIPLQPAAQNLWLIFGFLWLMAAAGLLIRKITVYQSFIKYLRAGRMEVTDMELWERLGTLAERAGIKRAVGLYTNSLISSPLLIGFFHPCIMLPYEKMADSDFENTILHELMHYRRRDMFYKWLVQVTICLHWFNPLVYWMGAEINRACEFSCDEAVISTFGRQAQLAYGETLLRAADAKGKYSDSLASVTLSENATLLKERLDAIMNYKKKSKITISISIILSALLLCGFALTGAYTVRAADKPQSPENNASRHDGRAPKNLQTKTAKAAHIIRKERPNLEISIDSNAAVKLVPTSAKDVTVDYADTLYDVSVENENGDWKVDISYIGSYSKYTSAVLHIPDTAFGEIGIHVDEATLYFNSVFRYGETINAKISDYASIFYTVPSGFQGTLNMTAPDCYLELYSDDGYKNCDVTISNGSTFGDIADGFTKRGNRFVYSDGTKAGVINIDLGSGGYVSIEAGASETAKPAKEPAPEPELYAPDSSEKLVIPVSLHTIGENEAVCIGEIPDIRDAVSFEYDITCGDSQGTISAGLRRPGLDSDWFFRCQVNITEDNSTLQTRFDNHFNSAMGIYDTYKGSYRFYIQNKGGTLSDISGTVTVQYGAVTPD